MANRMLQRRDVATDWTTADPILGDGEFGYETDTGKMKIGNGTDEWTALAYWSTGSGGGGSITFDGGSPTSDYSGGPAFDCGGVN
jgi:hypothetical protein